MANSDMLVRIKANTDNYNAGIARAKRTLEGFKQENLTIGGAVNQLTKSLTAAAAGYMSVAAAGSAITGLVKESVELAKAGEGIRLAFQRLNRPDLLDGLRQATHGTITDIELMKAAVRFDDFKLSLDDMGAMLAFAQQKAKDTGQSVDYMVESITMGLGRQSKQILDNLGISASEITERMKETGDMTKAVAEIIREQMSKAGDYVETASERATQAEVDLKNAMEQLGKVFVPLTEQANSFFSSIQIGAVKAMTKIGEMLNTLSAAGRAGNVVTGEDANIQKGLGKLKVAKAAGSDYMVRSLYNDQVESYNRRINDYDAQIKNGGKMPGAGSGESRDIRWLQAQRDGLVIARDQYIQQAKQIMNPIVNNTTVDTGGSGKGGSGGGSGRGGSIKTDQTELQKNQQTINTLTQEYVNISDNANEVTRARQEEIQKEIQLLEQRNNLLKLYAEQAHGKLQGGDIQTTELGSGSFAGSFKDMKIEGLSEDQMEKVRKGMEQLNNTASQSDKAFGAASGAVGALSSALAGIEDPGARAAGLVLQSLASIALGFASAAASPLVTGTGWGWLAFVGAGLAAVATTISTIHQLTGFAQGGIVEGNSYSGDNIYAGNGMINAGELVLTKAQQGNLASQLQGNGIQNMNIAGRIKGTDIILSIDRSLKLEGKQLLTWGR